MSKNVPDVTAITRSSPGPGLAFGIGADRPVQRLRRPVSEAQDMANLLPVVVSGPVTPASPNVLVTGVLAGAEVSVLADGGEIGRLVATVPGELRVPLAHAPAVGQMITALQALGGETSSPSPYPVAVIAVPSPLPTPVIASELNTGMADVWLNGLVPGATVVGEIGGQPFAKSQAPATGAWLGLEPTQPIPAGAILRVFQAMDGMAASPSAESLPIPAFSLEREHRLPQPQLAVPLRDCATARRFQSVTSGAVTTIENEGRAESWPNPAAAYDGYGGYPLKMGKLIAHQEMPRLALKSDPVTLGVEAVIPETPTVTQSLCPDTRRLRVSGLTPGGTLFVSRSVKDSPTTSHGTTLGYAGIAYPEQDFDIPADVALTDPAGPVVLQLTQILCEAGSKYAEVSVVEPAPLASAPSIAEPLYDCARLLVVKAAQPGALVQAFDADGTTPLSDLVPAPAANFVLPLWFPVKAGHKLKLIQIGCSAGGESPVVAVQDLPDPLPVPQVEAPVRPGAGSVKLSGVLPGARVHLLVDGKPRVGITSTQADPIVYLPPPLLVEGQRLFAIQTLCDRSSAPEGRGVTVVRGHLKISLSPATVNRSETSQVLVKTADADTGAPVTAQILLNGTVVGTSGMPFAYSPKPGDPNPAGVAREPVGYHDEPFTIALADPQYRIRLQAAPVQLYLAGLPITLDEVSWTLTPRWNAALRKEIKVTPTPPNAQATVTFPKPPGGSDQSIQATMAFRYSTPGGMAGDFYVPAGSATGAGDPVTIGFDGNDKTVGWLCQVQYVSNQVDALVFAVIAKWFGTEDF